jgi:hypothetical protein
MLDSPVIKMIFKENLVSMVVIMNNDYHAFFFFFLVTYPSNFNSIFVVLLLMSNLILSFPKEVNLVCSQTDFYSGNGKY